MSQTKTTKLIIKLVYVEKTTRHPSRHSLFQLFLSTSQTRVKNFQPQ